MNKGTEKNFRKQKKYIPESLDLETMLKERPPDFDYKIDHFIHILNLLTELPAYDKPLLTNQGFVPLNARRLQGHIPKYKEYLLYLVKNEVLESDNHYITGRRSIGYRFKAMFRTINREVQVDWSIYNHRYQKSKKMDSRSRYRTLANFFNDDLCIDAPSALEYIWMKLERDLVSGVINAHQKYNASILNIAKLQDYQYHFRVDDTSGRLHTSLTNLQKEIRNFITYRGESLVSVDISNSQPLLSTILLDRKFYEKTAVLDQKFSHSFNLFNIFPQLSSTHPTIYKFFPTIMIQFDEDSIHGQGKQDIDFYRQKVSKGMLYEYIAEEIFQVTGKWFNDRREIKNMIFSVLYSGNQFIGQPEAESKRLFRTLFPTVYEVFRLIKRNDKTLLPILLQTIEAKLVLNIIAKRFCQEKLGVPVFTIHDSIVCPVGYEEYAKSIMEQEIIKCIGITPTLKFEYWKPDFAFESLNKKISTALQLV